MKKQFFFLAGLPRAGSTLFSAILNQHPQIYASPNSPVLELVHFTAKFFFESEQTKAGTSLASMQDVLINLPQNFYDHVTKPIIMDKSRAWPGNIDLIKSTFNTTDPKIICLVRSVDEILLSFLDLIHKNPENNFVDRYLLARDIILSDKSRCEYLMSDYGIVHLSLNTLRIGFDEGRQYLHIIEYDDLMNHPNETMEKCYKFLGIDNFRHNFSEIDGSTTKENDEIYGLPGMHDVKPKLEKIKKQIPAFIKETYSNKFEFWRPKTMSKSIFRMTDTNSTFASEPATIITPTFKPEPFIPNLHAKIMIRPDFMKPELAAQLVEYGKNNIDVDLGVFDPDEANKAKDLAFLVDKSNRNTQIVKQNEDVMGILLSGLTYAVENYIEPFFGVSVKSAEHIQFLRYGIGGFYKPHCDGEGIWNNHGTLEWRRNMERDISVVIFLNSDFEGGELYFPDLGIKIPPKAGTLVAFPSDHHFMHGVSMIEKGERFSLVSWMDINEPAKK